MNIHFLSTNRGMNLFYVYDLIINVTDYKSISDIEDIIFV